MIAKKLFIAASLFMITALMTSTASGAWFERKVTEQPMSNDRLDVHEEDAKLEQRDDMEATPFAELEEAQKDKMITVQVDIMPNDDANEIIMGRDQRIEVAIMGSNDFDVEDIDPNSITLADAQSTGEFRVEDVNRDGILDLVGEFNIADLDLAEEEQELKLKGETKDGDSFKGTDSITLVAADLDHDDEMQS